MTKLYETAEGYLTSTEYANTRGIDQSVLSRILRQAKYKDCYFIDEKRRYNIDAKKLDDLRGISEDSIKQQVSKVMSGREDRNVSISATQEAESEASSEAPKGATYVQARTGNEIVKLKMAKLQLEEKKGSLLSAQVVAEETFEMARTIRDQLMAIPDRVAPQFAAEKDERAIHKELSREIRSALSKVFQIIAEREKS